MGGEAEQVGTPDNGSGRTRRPWRVRFFLRLFVLLTMLVTVLLGTAMIRYTIRFPDPTALRQRQQAPVVRVLARDGSVLAERGSASVVPIAELPPHVIHAVIAIEDRRFFDHYGLDPRGLVRATLSNLRTARYAQGGSTLTQQLAKNLFLSSDRTIVRKLEEVVLALWLEVRLGKAGILELYLNRVYFGAGVYGIEAAAQRYFAKSARALTVPEAAIIAGLLKAPSRLSPASRPEAAASRAILVLAAMRDAGFIDETGYAAALQQPVTYAATDTARAETGLEYAVDYVLDRLPPLVGNGHSGIVVETTIDRTLQRQAQTIVARRLATAAGTTDDTQAGVVVLDPEGGVRALVGGRAWSRSQFNRAVSARRQPGSAFKPVVFLGALEGGARPDTIVHDRPITIGGWSPRNNRDTYAGAMTLRHALAHSVNTIAVALQQDVGAKRVAAMARRLGITSTLREDASLALGTSEVTLIELTGAYGVLASGGINLTPHVIRRVRTDDGLVLHARPVSRPATVIAPAHVARMNDMLHAVLTTGSGRRAALPVHPAGGKTGTTQDNRDAWFVGYTAHLTAGVWTGNDDGSPMNGITGSGLPALIWRDVMQEAHRALSPLPLPGVREGAAPVVATGPVTSPRPVPTQHRHAATIAKRAAPIRPTTPIDPALFAAPTRPALDTLRLEALLRAK
jgi:penicillin-binding protein 1A